MEFWRLRQGFQSTQLRKIIERTTFEFETEARELICGRKIDETLLDVVDSLERGCLDLYLFRLRVGQNDGDRVRP